MVVTIGVFFIIKKMYQSTPKMTENLLENLNVLKLVIREYMKLFH